MILNCNPTHSFIFFGQFYSYCYAVISIFVLIFPYLPHSLIFFPFSETPPVLFSPFYLCCSQTILMFLFVFSSLHALSLDGFDDTFFILFYRLLEYQVGPNHNSFAFTYSSFIYNWCSPFSFFIFFPSRTPISLDPTRTF